VFSRKVRKSSTRADHCLLLPYSPNAGIRTELLRTIRGLRGFALLLYDLHMLFVHTTAMHLELGQSTVDLFHVFCGQYKFGGFDVLLKVLNLARSRPTQLAK
jgi:hypothetical protein